MEEKIREADGQTGWQRYLSKVRHDSSMLKLFPPPQLHTAVRNPVHHFWQAHGKSVDRNEPKGILHYCWERNLAQLRLHKCNLFHTLLCLCKTLFSQYLKFLSNVVWDFQVWVWRTFYTVAQNNSLYQSCKKRFSLDPRFEWTVLHHCRKDLSTIFRF